jgi:hypothetical protein
LAKSFERRDGNTKNFENCKVLSCHSVLQFHVVFVCRKSSSAPIVSSDSGPASNPSANPFANPFANPLGNSFAPALPQPAANPFASVSFSSTNSVSFGFDNSKKPAEITAPFLSEESGGGSKAANETEYQKKMKKLNESCVCWCVRQISEKATAIWKDGVDVRVVVVSLPLSEYFS